MTTAALPQQAAIDSAVRYLISNYSPKGNKVGWLMMASILVEAWDLYSIAFVLIFIRDQYHPDPLAARPRRRGHPGRRAGRRAARRLAVRQDRPARDVPRHDDPVHRAGAGAGVRAPASDAGGRPPAARHSRSAATSPPATPTSWSSMPKGEREVMGNRWQFMFAVGEVLTLAVIAVFLISRHATTRLVWRVHARPRRGAGRDHPVSCATTCRRPRSG